MGFKSLFIIAALSLLLLASIVGIEITDLPDYASMKFVKGFTASGIPTPFVDGAPQECLNCVEGEASG